MTPRITKCAKNKSSDGWSLRYIVKIGDTVYRLTKWDRSGWNVERLHKPKGSYFVVGSKLNSYRSAKEYAIKHSDEWTETGLDWETFSPIGNKL